MKLNKYFSWLALSLMLIASGAMLTSCEEKAYEFELTDGVPEVSYIRMPYLSAADSLISEASLSSIICIVGNNLTSIKELYFNDKKAQLNTSYITNHTLLVQVPSDIPGEVSDKMYMVTKGGETVEHDFHVVVPAPSVSSMSCEYAPAGSSVTIYGNYFIDDPNVPLKVTLPDGQEVTEFTGFTQSTITFNMPECTAEGKISVTSIYGETESAFHYLDSRGIMFDFDGLTGLGNHGWHARDILSDETSIAGNFMQLGDGTAKMSEDGGWDDSKFSFEYWCGSWDDPQNITSGDGIALNNLVDFTNFENMSLKFEMFVPSSSPWSAGAMQISFEGVDRITYSGNPVSGFTTVGQPSGKTFNGDDGMGTWGRAMYRPWMENGSFDTGDKWITVTIPLKNFNFDRTGAVTQDLAKSAADFASFTMFVVGGGVNGTECTPIIKVDNIRVVPNK